MFVTKAENEIELEKFLPVVSENYSLAWSITLTNGFFIPLVVLFVGLRVFTRAFMTRHVFADDCMYITYYSSLLPFIYLSEDILQRKETDLEILTHQKT